MTHCRHCREEAGQHDVFPEPGAKTEEFQRMLERAKQQLKGSMMLSLESMSNRMMRLGRVELTFERYFTLDEVMAEIDAVSAEDVRAVAEELFQPERLSSVAIVPA